MLGIAKVQEWLGRAEHKRRLESAVLDARLNETIEIAKSVADDVIRQCREHVSQFDMKPETCLFPKACPFVDPDLKVARTYDMVDEYNEALRRQRSLSEGASTPVDTGSERTPFPPDPRVSKENQE